MSNELADNKAQGEHVSAKVYASKVFAKTSVCAVSAILLNENKPRKIFRGVVFFLFTVAFFYQCIAFLCYVLQNPNVVDIETIRPDIFLSPAITFCNVNTMKRSKVCAKYPGNCTNPGKRFCDENPRFCGTPDTQIVHDGFEIDDIDELFHLNHEAEDMVPEDAEYYPDDGPFPRWIPNEPEIGACFSYFDRVSSSLDPKMKRRMPYGIGNQEMFEFDPRENELIHATDVSGIVFEIHSPFEAVNPFDTGIYMRPGYFYKIQVKMTQEEMLSQVCLNYTEVWLKNNKTGYRSQAACKEKCIGDMIMKCINCTEPHILYPYPNANLCKHGPENTENKGVCKDLEESRNLIEECINDCKLDCIKTKFSYHVQEKFQKRYALSVAKIESRSIRVAVDFPEADIQKTIHKPQFQVLEIFSLIGGLLAFWIGLSMYQVVEVFDCLFQMRKYFFKKRPEESVTSSA